MGAKKYVGRYANRPYAASGTKMLPPTGSVAQEFREQSENVYENKGPAWNWTTLIPRYPRRGITGSPPQMRRGWGWWDFESFACFAAWRRGKITRPTSEKRAREKRL